MEANQETFDHVMIDIETLGSESNSAILSVGAVEINLITGSTGKTFQKKEKVEQTISNPIKINTFKIPCPCACHRQNGITHVAACCNNGYL